jgi:hypothetical protein
VVDCERFSAKLVNFFRFDFDKKGNDAALNNRCKLHKFHLNSEIIFTKKTIDFVRFGK